MGASGCANLPSRLFANILRVVAHPKLQVSRTIHHGWVILSTPGIWCHVVLPDRRLPAAKPTRDVHRHRASGHLLQRLPVRCAQHVDAHAPGEYDAPSPKDGPGVGYLDGR